VCAHTGVALQGFKESGKWQGGKALPLSHEAQNGPPCFLNSFSERSLGVAGSTSSPRLGQWPLVRVSICLSEALQGLSLKEFHKVETIGNFFKQLVSQIWDCR